MTLLKHERSRATASESQHTPHSGNLASTSLDKLKASPLLVVAPVKQVGKTLGAIGRFIGDGDVIDLTVGLVLGETVFLIIQSIVADLLSPILSLAFGNSAQLENMFVYLKVPEICRSESAVYSAKDCALLNTPQLAQGTPPPSYIPENGGITWNWGRALQNIVNFLLIVLVLFAMVRSYCRAYKKGENIGSCPHCFKDVDVRATRCGSCTSPLDKHVDIEGNTSGDNGLLGSDETFYPKNSNDIESGTRPSRESIYYAAME